MNDRTLIVEYRVKENPRTEPRLKQLKNGLKVTVELTEKKLTELVLAGLEQATETRRPTPRRQGLKAPATG